MSRRYCFALVLFWNLSYRQIGVIECLWVVRRHNQNFLLGLSDLSAIITWLFPGSLFLYISDTGKMTDKRNNSAMFSLWTSEWNRGYLKEREWGVIYSTGNYTMKEISLHPQNSLFMYPGRRKRGTLCSLGVLCAFFPFHEAMLAGSVFHGSHAGNHSCNNDHVIGEGQYSDVHSNIYHICCARGREEMNAEWTWKRLQIYLNFLKFYLYSILSKWRCRKTCLLRGYILVRNMASIPPKKEDRVCKYIGSGLWTVIIQPFLKVTAWKSSSLLRVCISVMGESADFQAVSWSVVAFHARVRNFLFIVLTQKGSKFAPPWKCIIKGEFSMFKNGL